jgi:hypothetical protein
VNVYQPKFKIALQQKTFDMMDQCAFLHEGERVFAFAYVIKPRGKGGAPCGCGVKHFAMCSLTKRA